MIIFLAGELEWETGQHRKLHGGVVVPPSLLSDMKSLRDTLPEMVKKYPKLPFE